MRIWHSPCLPEQTCRSCLKEKVSDLVHSLPEEKEEQAEDEPERVVQDGQHLIKAQDEHGRNGPEGWPAVARCSIRLLCCLSLCATIRTSQPPPPASTIHSDINMGTRTLSLLMCSRNTSSIGGRER